METTSLAASLVFYILASRLVMRRLGGGLRETVMALLNLTSVFVFLFYNHNHGDYRLKFAIYVGIVIFQYVMLRAFSEARSWLHWLAFFSPIAALIAVRYVPGQIYLALGRSFGMNWHGIPNLIGISYLAFRCSRLVLEIRNGSVKKPGFLEYLNFAFFLPTMSLGPINTYANFRRGFATAPWEAPVGRAALRVLVGLVKYEFLGGVFSQLTYSAFLLNNHPHYWIDLPIAMAFYYLYLYCNFSGFCDLAIGAAALIGIPVPENFDNPFLARNMKELWNRWHITLSQWMRDIVFAPLAKFLVGWFGPAQANHAIALAVAVVFLLVGVWHGAGWNFVAYGAAQALGVVAVHYYTIFLKKRLGREGFKAYNENSCIQVAAAAITFCYFSASLIFFACTFDQIRQILAVLK